MEQARVFKRVDDVELAGQPAGVVWVELEQPVEVSSRYWLPSSDVQAIGELAGAGSYLVVTDDRVQPVEITARRVFDKVEPPEPPAEDEPAHEADPARVKLAMVEASSGFAAGVESARRTEIETQLDRLSGVHPAGDDVAAAEKRRLEAELASLDDEPQS